VNDPDELDLSWLFQQAQAGNRASYQQFLLRTRQMVASALRSRLRSAAELDDVVQETLLSIHRYRHTYDPARPIGPWIHTIALNRFRDHLRARAREGNPLELAQETSVPAAPADDTATLSLLYRALDALSAAQREVIWLLKFEGYSVVEIAERTGRSTASVKVTAHRGYRVLRARLESG